MHTIHQAAAVWQSPKAIHQACITRGLFAPCITKAISQFVVTSSPGGSIRMGPAGVEDLILLDFTGFDLIIIKAQVKQRTRFLLGLWMSVCRLIDC